MSYWSSRMYAVQNISVHVTLAQNFEQSIYASDVRIETPKRRAPLSLAITSFYHIPSILLEPRFTDLQLLKSLVFIYNS